MQNNKNVLKNQKSGKGRETRYLNYAILHSIIVVKLYSNDVKKLLFTFVQFMKPLYQQFVEKSVSVAVAQAAEIAVTNSSLNATATANGKPKFL